MNQKKTKIVKGSNDVYLEVVNELGVECIFSFNALPDKEFNLSSSSSETFTKNNLLDMTHHLSDEELLYVKDKLTIKILDRIKPYNKM